MAPNECFELGSDELAPLLLTGLIAQGSALLCCGFGCLSLGSVGALLATTKATLESLDTTSGVDDLHLTGEERVTRRGDLDLVQRVRLAVFPLDGLARGDGGLREEGEVR